LRMPEYLHYDPCGYPLGEEQGCAGVSQVVKPSQGDPGTLEEPLELMSNDCSIERMAVCAREHQIPLIPSLSDTPALDKLARPMFVEDFGDRSRHDYRAPAACGLGFN